MRNKRQSLLLFLFFTLFITGCDDLSETHNDKPMSYWINDHDSCVSGMAQAIVDSGEPYPNFIYETITEPKTGEQEKKLKAFDLWLGKERYRIPAEYLVRRYSYATKHPYRYMGLHGTLPNFYPAGPSAGVKDGMASRVDISFQCSMEAFYEESWGKGFRSREQGIAKLKKYYQKRSDSWNEHFKVTQSQVTVSVREDLHMTEVLWDFSTDTNPKREGINGGWEASYWPLENEMSNFHGGVGGIRCDIRHDVEKRYNNRGWRCRTALRINKNVSARIDIYVSHLAAMPALYQQIKQLFIDTKIKE